MSPCQLSHRPRHHGRGENEMNKREAEQAKATLRGANLLGLLSATEWIKLFFETDDGIIVYKRIGGVDHRA